MGLVAVAVRANVGDQVYLQIQPLQRGPAAGVIARESALEISLFNSQLVSLTCLEPLRSWGKFDFTELTRFAVVLESGNAPTLRLPRPIRSVCHSYADFGFVRRRETPT